MDDMGQVHRVRTFHKDGRVGIEVSTSAGVAMVLRLPANDAADIGHMILQSAAECLAMAGSAPAVAVDGRKEAIRTGISLN